MAEPPRTDQRKSPRYSCILEASWQGSEPIRFKPAWPIRVVNISRGGLGLHAGEKFEIGAILTLGFSGGLSPIKVRVVHVTEQENGTYVLGGEFLQEISEEVLQSLLKG